jgi:hypothetical protein
MSATDIDARPWRGVRLSVNFMLGEFAVSADWPALAAGITFSGAEVLRLWRMVHWFLQPLRDAFGPVAVLSGKRTTLLNRAVGGAALSDHLMLGLSCAVDFRAVKLSPWEMAAWILAHAELKRIPFKQLIIYPAAGFVHLSLPDESDKLHRVSEFRGRNRYLPLGSEDVFAHVA